jgi:3-isopropylmalate/(R)-2-methylmalate dehydratase small subunit
MGAEKIQIVEGRALPLRGDDIDTDRIMPARFLKSITFDGLGTHVFEDDRLAATRDGKTHPFDGEDYQGRSPLSHSGGRLEFTRASILLVNRNFGTGSSREHAPQGLQRWGIRAVIGESFAEIFFGNSLMIGLPCVTAAAKDIETLMRLVEEDPSVELRIDLGAGICDAEGLRVPIAMPDHVRDTLMTGAWDTTGLLLDNYEQVNAVAAKLPYLSGF